MAQRSYRRRSEERPRGHGPRRRPSGFTLIELLVVVSIIVLLIALLLPALKRVRFTARTNVCVSQTRQQVNALVSYALDHGARLFPIDHTPGEYWHSMLRDHAGLGMKTIICPEASEPSFGWGSAHRAWGPGGGFMDGHSGSYGMNLWLLPEGAFSADGNMQQDGYYRHTRQSMASNIPVFADSPWVGSWPDDIDPMASDLQTGTVSVHAHGSFMGRFTIDRHDMAINVGFLDGNARTVKLNDLWRLKWHRKFQLGDPP